MWELYFREIIEDNNEFIYVFIFCEKNLYFLLNFIIKIFFFIMNNIYGFFIKIFL